MSNKEPKVFKITVRQAPEGGLTFIYEHSQLGQLYENGKLVEQEMTLREVQPEAQFPVAEFEAWKLRMSGNQTEEDCARYFWWLANQAKKG